MARLRNDAEATFEFHLFNGIQGVVKDPRDGATVDQLLHRVRHHAGCRGRF